jgi:hypothetical protein
MHDRMFVELWRSRLYIYSKYYSRPAQTALRALVRAAMLRDIIVGNLFRSSRANRNGRSNRARRAKAVLRMMGRP